MRTIPVLAGIALIYSMRFLPLKKRRIQRLIPWIALAIEVCIIAAMGRWKLLFSVNNLDPFFLILSPILGTFLFYISLLINRLSFREATKYTFPFAHILRFYATHLNRLGHYILVSLREELLWRATVQYAMGNSPLAVVITALLFTVIHIRSNKVNLLELSDFMIFSLFLGFVFWRYENLVFVILIHTIRNMNLIFYYSVIRRRRARRCRSSIAIQE